MAGDSRQRRAEGEEKREEEKDVGEEAEVQLSPESCTLRYVAVHIIRVIHTASWIQVSTSPQPRTTALGFGSDRFWQIRGEGVSTRPRGLRMLLD